MYSSIYPDSKIKLNKEDWAICNLNISDDHSDKVCDYLEQVNNRIDISKTSSLQTSEIFIEKLLQHLQPYHKEIYGTIEPFCDNREQGLMLSIYNQMTNDQFYIWSCESKTDKELMIVTSKDKTKENLFMLDDLEKAQYYKNNDFNSAIKYCVDELDKFLGKDLKIKF